MKVFNFTLRFKKLCFGARFGLKKAFTLPEVIISFSILILVITAATGILVSVIRSNNDNVNSLVAYGLAQEGLEGVRFVRDSNAILGLGFDGAPKNSSGAGAAVSPWGEKGETIFDKNSSSDVKFFALDFNNGVDGLSCKNTNLDACLPLQFRSLTGDLESLKTNSATVVYKRSDLASSAPQVSKVIFYQGENKIDENDGDSGFHRFIRIEPIASKAVVDKLRISSVVSWVGQGGLPKSLVLSSELTDWK